MSREAANKMRDFLVSLAEPENDSIPLADLDDEVGDTYSVCYGSQLLTEHGLYNGQPARIVKSYRSMTDISKWATVDVVLPPSTEVVSIHVAKFQIPYHLTPKEAPCE